MILVALVPPVWRRVMDPRVLDHYGGQVQLANRREGGRVHWGRHPRPVAGTAAVPPA
jgi:alkane 1-monooxygenase